MGSLFTKRYRNGKPEGIPGRFTKTSEAEYIISSRDDLLGQDRRPHSVRSQQVSTNWIGSQTEIYPWTSCTDVSDDPYYTVPSDAQSFSSQEVIYSWPSSNDVSDDPYNTVQSDAESFSSQEEIIIDGPIRQSFRTKRRVPSPPGLFNAEIDQGYAVLEQPNEKSPCRLCPVHFRPLHTGLCDSNCTDKHRDRIIEYMVEVFKPLITKRIDPLEVVPYLDFIDSGMIRSLECPQKSVERLIGLIHRSNTPGKWTAFSDALLRAENPHLHALVNSKTEKDNTIQEKFMKLRAPDIAQNMCVADVLDKLEEEEVISVTDKERVMAMNKQKGETHAALLLLDLVPNRIEDWDSRFIRTLRACGMAEFADSLEEAMPLKTSHEKVLPENHATETTEVKQEATQRTRNSYTPMPGGGLKAPTEQSATQEIDITPPKLPPRQCAIEDINSSERTEVTRRLQERPKLPPRYPGTTQVVSHNDANEASIVLHSVSDSTQKHDKPYLQDDKIHDSRDFSGVCNSYEYSKSGSNQSDNYDDTVVKRLHKQSCEHQMENNIDNSEVQGILQVAKKATKSHQGQLNFLETLDLPEETTEVKQVATQSTRNSYTPMPGGGLNTSTEQSATQEIDITPPKLPPRQYPIEDINSSDRTKVNRRLQERPKLPPRYPGTTHLVSQNENATVASTVGPSVSDSTHDNEQQSYNDTAAIRRFEDQKEDSIDSTSLRAFRKLIQEANESTNGKLNYIEKLIHLLQEERCNLASSWEYLPLIFQDSNARTVEEVCSQDTSGSSEQLDNENENGDPATTGICNNTSETVQAAAIPTTTFEGQNINLAAERRDVFQTDGNFQNQLSPKSAEGARQVETAHQLTQLPTSCLTPLDDKHLNGFTATDPLSDAKNAQSLSMSNLLIQHLVHKIDQLEANLKETKKQNYVKIEGPRICGHTSQCQSQAQLPLVRGPEQQYGYHLFAPHTNTQSPYFHGNWFPNIQHDPHIRDDQITPQGNTQIPVFINNGYRYTGQEYHNQQFVPHTNTQSPYFHGNRFPNIHHDPHIRVDKITPQGNTQIPFFSNNGFRYTGQEYHNQQFVPQIYMPGIRQFSNLYGNSTPFSNQDPQYSNYPLVPESNMHGNMQFSNTYGNSTPRSDQNPGLRNHQFIPPTSTHITNSPRFNYPQSFGMPQNPEHLINR